jgi:hypothetical protein
VYVPAIDAEGLIAPVNELMLKPAVELNVPSEVPVKVTDCEVELVLQNGPPA